MEVPPQPDDVNMGRLKRAAGVCGLHVNFFLEAAGAECRHIIETDGCPVLHITDEPGAGPTYVFREGVSGADKLSKQPSIINIEPNKKFL